MTQSITKARAIIIHGLENKPLRMCLPDKSNPFRMWMTLNERHAVSNIGTRVQLQSKLSLTAYRGQRMTEFIDDSESVFNHMVAMNSPVSEEPYVDMLLASLEEKHKSAYGHMVAVIHSSENSLKWETRTSRLLQEYEKRIWENPKSRHSCRSCDDSTVALHVRETPR